MKYEAFLESFIVMNLISFIRFLTKIFLGTPCMLMNITFHMIIYIYNFTIMYVWHHMAIAEWLHMYQVLFMLWGHTSVFTVTSGDSQKASPHKVNNSF